MALTGYPVEDLALRPSFQIASAKSIQVLAAILPAKLISIVGYLDHIDGAPQNRVAVITDGKIVATYTKCQLPNYGVFDEYRNFVPGDSTLVLRIHGIDVGILICEDLWIDGGITSKLAARKPGLGRLSDEKGRRFVAVIGSSALFISTALLLFTFQAWIFFPAMIFSGIAGAYLSTVPGSLVGDVLKGKGGQVIAVMQMSGDFAAMIAPILLGAISDAGGFRPAFILATLLMAAVVLVTTRIPETRNSIHYSP
jgi:hypothetical protein